MYAEYMTLLPVLIELQATHDYLRTIERDLSALPPDLAALHAEMKAQDKRLGELESDLNLEPVRVREGYETHAQRVEPVGLVYLWPVTG